ncbi:VOC family protein [Nonomuraea sp. LPB2021202275-12-8]|uniref:VOC family protein n=1 Tax=Nonomuraea sp. LPB2021202275-12-8 TaxID=3120159 RepID=UPI00300D9BE0
MLTTQFLPGTPCWIDLGSHDLEASARFYTGVFDWRFESMAPDYGLFKADGKTVAAIGSSTDEGAKPAWMLYFQSPDCDATTKAVELAGGTVRVQPMEIEGQGRLAQFTDPAGAEFAVWQPGGNAGLDLVTAPRSLAWAELYVPDPAAVREFYQSVFGWRIQDVPMGDDFVYPVVSPAEGDQEETSMAGLAELQPGDHPHWLSFFEVSDCDAAVAKSQQLGGTALAPPMDIEDVGRLAFVNDPHGARFAVITSSA